MDNWQDFIKAYKLTATVEPGMAGGLPIPVPAHHESFFWTVTVKSPRGEERLFIWDRQLLPMNGRVALHLGLSLWHNFVDDGGTHFVETYM
jgi:hypothetical protein